MILSFLPIVALAAVPSSLTPEQFLNKGTGVMLGEIVDIQVVQQVRRSEYGKVKMKVYEVLSGKMDASFVYFPFIRRRGLTMLDSWGMDHSWAMDGPQIDSCCWDNIILARGQKLIIYFRERGEDGTYQLSQSIQKGVFPYDDPEVRALYEIVDNDRTYYLDYQVDNSVQEIDSYDDPKVKALRELTGH